MRHAIEKPTFARRDDRGTFLEVRNSGPWETVVCGRMKAGSVMGQHYHKRTTICFFLSSGAARVDILNVETKERDRVELPAGHGVTLHPGETHAIRFAEPSDFVLLKSRRYDPEDADTYAYPIPE